MQEPDDSIDLRGTSFDWTRRELLAVTAVSGALLGGQVMPRPCHRPQLKEVQRRSLRSTSFCASTGTDTV
jgi:hypothetical protein